MEFLKQFFRLEAAGGAMLVAAAALALVVANSPAASLYVAALGTSIGFHVGSWALAKPALLWINDGLMAVFFLLVGLEIKREFLEGELGERGQALLPVLAAAGGFVVPILVYLALNHADPQAAAGWAIPSATDIAFALGILALLGGRVPTNLKLFLSTIAVVDDLAAIVVIALFYTSSLSSVALVAAVFMTAILVLLNRIGVRDIRLYLIGGALLWLFVLKSGVHATIAGVVTAWAIPLRGPAERPSPARQLEHALHPWVAYLILPLFAFANAGVDLRGTGLAALGERVTLGIFLGLLLGKQTGVMLGSWLAVRSGLSRLPDGVRWPAVYGAALLAGIGFTMSLFISTLAFEHGDFNFDTQVRIGVLGASVVSACAGFGVLRWKLAPDVAS